MVVSSLSTFSVCSFWHSFFSIENFIFEKLFTAARYLWKVTYHFSIIVINWPFLAGLVVHGQLDGYSGCFLVASFSPCHVSDFIYFIVLIFSLSQSYSESFINILLAFSISLCYPSFLFSSLSASNMSAMILESLILLIVL